jgi:hypothetical protein
MIELCFGLRIPARFWTRGYAGVIVLTEEGEELLHVIGRAVDRSLRAGAAWQVITRAGVEHTAADWCTRWPGPEGLPVGALAETAGEDDTVVDGTED